MSHLSHLQDVGFIPAAESRSRASPTNPYRSDGRRKNCSRPLRGEPFTTMDRVKKSREDERGHIGFTAT